MRMKKILSIILSLCMLACMCQFSIVSSAETASTSQVTMAQTKYASGVDTLTCTITTDSADWWAAIYPASQTTYGSGTGTYCDYLDRNGGTGELTWPSGVAIRMKKWPLPDGQWKIVLFEHDDYTSAVSEAYFTVGYGDLYLDKTEFEVGEDIVFNYRYSNSSRDFISIYNIENAEGTTSTSGERAWAYTPNGTGTVTQTAFTNTNWATTPGDYVAKYWSNDKYELELGRVAFTIKAAPTTEVYVSASGDDSAAGTSDAPVATIAKAFELLETTRDNTIYVSGSVAFADVPHTNKVTYAPADDTAVFSGDISLSGPSIVNVPMTAGKTLTTNGNLISLGGHENSYYSGKTTGSGSLVVVGNSSGNDETVEITGGYYTNVYTRLDGQTKGKVRINVNGGLLRMVAFGHKTDATNVVGDVDVVVNSGEVHFTNIGKLGSTTADGAFQIVFNNGTYTSTIKPTILGGSGNPESTNTKLQDYANGKITFTDGKWIVYTNNTDGKTLDVTETPGRFKLVNSNQRAYTVSGNKIYASVDGYLTLPAGTHEVKFAQNPASQVAPVAASEGKAFSHWEEATPGVLTPVFVDVDYYVSASGDDANDGKTTTTALKTIGAAIAKIGNADAVIGVIGAKYTFADAAHTGTIKYLPYNSTATLAGGSVTVNGPSVINVNSAAAINYYANCNYLEIGGYVNTSVGNIVHVNTADVTKVVLKGQYFADFHAQVANQQGGDCLLVIDGATVNNCRPGPRAAGAVSYGKFRVVVKNGDLRFSNTYSSSDNTTSDAFTTFVFNNNTFFTITPHVFSSVTRTNFLNYLFGNATFRGGEALWRSEEPGNYVIPTSTHGVYDVEGDKIAYYQTSDKKTVYYSYNGKITLPDINNGDILWMDEIDTDLFAIPGAQNGVAFVEWDDDGEGTITASYQKTPDYYEFYVKSGGTGDGTSVEKAAPDIPTVIATINADGHDENSEVTVYLIDSGEIRDVGATVTRNQVKSYKMNYLYGADHTAKITYTTYGYNPEDDNRAVLYLNCDYVPAGNDPTTLRTRGPSKFENLIIMDCRTEYPTDVNAQGYDFEIKNVTFRRLNVAKPASGSEWDTDGTAGISNAEYKAYVNDTNPDATIKAKTDGPFYTGANRNGTGTIAEGGLSIIDDPSVFVSIIFGGYSDNVSYNASMTYENSHTIVLNGDLIGGSKNFVTLSSLKDNSFVQTYKKDANLVINGATVREFKTTTKAVVEGAIQVILNNGAELTTFTAVDNAAKDATSDVGTARYFVMDSKNNAGTLNVTDNTGEFEIISDKAYAYAYSDDTETAYYGKDILKVVESGKYTVNYADSVEAILAEIPDKADNEEEGLIFTGWTDNGDGTLSASFRPKEAVTKEYYVMFGGTGDGRSVNAPAGSVNDVIASVNADGLIKGDTAVVYIMEHPDFIDETTGKFADEGKVSTQASLVSGTFTYWKVDGGYIPSHTATLKITSYDYEAGNADKPMKHLAFSDKIGANHAMGLGGPTIFENIALVRPRNVDREVRTNGYDVEFNNTIVYQAKADFWAGTAFSGLEENHANIITGGDSSTQLGGTIRFNSRLIASEKNSHGIGLRSYSRASTFSERVTLYLNNSEISSQFNWGNANDAYSTTFNGGVTIVSNAFASLFYPTSADYVNDAPVVIKGGLEIINNNGMKFPEVPSNVTADATWIVNSGANAGGTLDTTGTAGSFKVLGGKYAYVQSTDKKTIIYSNDVLTLEPGEYTVLYADSVDAIKAAAVNPGDIDEYNIFNGWEDDGEGTLTAKYVYSIPTYYVAATGGSDANDGLTPETAFATTTKAIDTIEANGKNGVVNVIGKVTLTLKAHENRIYWESYNGGTVAGASNKITLCGPTVLNADFAAAQSIYTVGHYLELGGTVNQSQNNYIYAGNLNNTTGTDQDIVLRGKFVYKMTTHLSQQTTGNVNIFIDGGILRQMSSGSGVENDGTYKVDSVSITVKSGEFWCFNHTDEGTHKTPGTFEYITNGNSYYFPDGRQLLASVKITSWADYTLNNKEGFVKILFEGGKYVIRNADKENFIYRGDSVGQFTYEGAKTPYFISENGLTVYYGKDGKINLPTGDVDVLWAVSFSAEDMPEPNLASGYEFGGWADDGNGTLTALVINPNFYFVDGENGDDTNLGTQDNPYKTISKAISALDGKNGKVYIIGSAVYDLDSETAFEGYVTIEGVGENASVVFDEDNGGTVVVNVMGNTKFANVTFDMGDHDSAWFTFRSDARFEIFDDVTIEDDKVVRINPDVDNAKLVLNNGVYEIGGAKNSLDVVANNAELSLHMIYSCNTNITADNSKIYATEYFCCAAPMQIVANNCVVDDSIKGNTITVIESANDNGARVDLSTEAGKFSVKTEYGKTPIAVAEDGTIYVADEFTTEDIAPATWYDRHEYDEYINYRKPLNNTYKKLTEDKELTVAYFGGSVTNGSGKSDCWRELIGQWIIDNFPEADVTNINRACGESGTYLGTYRLQGDVIAVKPDLVFLEYSINDKYYGSSYADAASQYETIVREIKQALPETDIVTVLVSDTGTFGVNKQGQLHTQAQAHEDMAAIYGIPTLHVGRRIAEVCNYTASNFTGTYGTDGVHLTSAGNYIYYQVIEEYFHNSLLCTDFAGLPERNDELPVTQNKLFDGNRTWYEPTPELLAKSETLGGQGVTRKDGNSYTTSNFITESEGQYIFNSTDDEFFFEFNGTDVALWSNYYKSNYFLISIDGGEYIEVEGTSHAPAKIVNGLAPGNHKIGIKIKDSTQLSIRSIYTRDTSKATPAGTAHTYTDFANATFTLPAGSYNVSYVDADTVADLPVEVGDSKILLGFTNPENEVVESTAAVEAGMIVCPVFFDVNDYIEYDGVQIRLNDPIGLRFICELFDSAYNFDGITVDGYGMVIIPSKVLGDTRTYEDYDANVVNSTANVVGAEELRIGKVYNFNNKDYAVGNVEAKVNFADTDAGVQYTACLIGLNPTAQGYAEYYTARAYLKVTFGGQEYVLYTNPFRSNIYEVAKKGAEDESGANYATFKSYVDLVEGN